MPISVPGRGGAAMNSPGSVGPFLPLVSSWDPCSAHGGLPGASPEPLGPASRSLACSLSAARLGGPRPCLRLTGPPLCCRLRCQAPVVFPVRWLRGFRAAPAHLAASLRSSHTAHPSCPARGEGLPAAALTSVPVEALVCLLGLFRGFCLVLLFGTDSPASLSPLLLGAGFRAFHETATAPSPPHQPRSGLGQTNPVGHLPGLWLSPEW